jgi:lysozyme
MNAADLIRQHEGLRLDMYQCPAGKWTIGYGHNLEANGISKAIAEAILQEDIHAVEGQLRQYYWFENLDPARRAAVVDMAFNLGIAGFAKFHNLITALGEGDFEAAANAAQDSKWFTQVGNRGKRIVQILRTGA